jgi:hypothetical protein
MFVELDRIREKIIVHINRLPPKYKLDALRMELTFPAIQSS